MKISRLVLALALLSAAPWSPANTAVRVDLRASGYPREILSRSNDVLSQGDLTVGPASGSAYSNLEAGSVWASIVAPAGSTSIAQGVMDDSVSFSDGATGTAFLDWSFTATLGPYIRSTGLQAELDVSIGDILYAYVLSNNVCDTSDFTGGAPTSCAVGTSIDASGSIPIPIHSGATDVLAAVVLGGDYAGPTTFTSSAHLFLRTPEGVRYTSGTGVYLVGAGPIIAAIPEPETYALFLAGLAMTPVLLRRKRRE